jgi:hypothetical protein
LLSATATTASNTREFYLQLSGFGPTTNGDSQHDATTKWVQSSPWQKYLTVSADWNTNASQLLQARALNWSVTATVHGSPRYNARSSNPWENFTYAMLQYKLAGFSQDEILCEYITEDDSAGVGFPQDLLALARASGYSSGATRLTPTQAQSAWKGYVQEAYTTTSPYPKIRRHARVGYPQSTHSVAPTTNLVLVEVANDDVGTLPPALMFLRGAATQFDIQWGVDLSLWWGVISACVEDLPSSLHVRTMVHSYVAGARVVSVEGCGWMNSTGNPNEMAQAVDKFGHLLLRLEPHRRKSSASSPSPSSGDPDKLLAVVIDENMGWSERPSWYTGSRTTLWSYANLPSSQNPLASAFDALVQATFPGVGDFGFLAFPLGAFKKPLDPPGSFSRTYVTEPYVPNTEDIFYAPPNLPFGNFETRKTLHEWFEKSKVDPAPYRPMADSKYGNVVDVHVDDGVHYVWDEYKILWWSSQKPLGGLAVRALRNHAEKGGIVVLPIGVTSEDLDLTTNLTGVRASGAVRAVRAWKINSGEQDHAAAEIVHEDHFLIASVESMDQDVSVVASSIPEVNPIVIKKPIGKGWIYTCLSPFYGASHGMDKPVQTLLENLLRPIQHVVIEQGPQTLFWTTSRWDEGSARVVSVSNNADAVWQGRLLLKVDDLSGCDDHLASVKCVGLWGEESVQCERSNKSLVLLNKMTIDAYGIVVVKVSCSAVSHSGPSER